MTAERRWCQVFKSLGQRHEIFERESPNCGAFIDLLQEAVLTVIKFCLASSTLRVFDADCRTIVQEAKAYLTIKIIMFYFHFLPANFLTFAVYYMLLRYLNGRMGHVLEQ
jgi:hypothetical protein